MDSQPSQGNGSPPAGGSHSFGRYQLLARLATGGMGEILLARLAGDGGFQKHVVIKRLLPHLVENQRFTSMLLDEARIAAQLNHPNICQVNDLGSVGGRYYLAMEYLEGVPVSHILTSNARAGQDMDVSVALSIIHDACLGLDYAHKLQDGDGNKIGLVHRDVSPSNLFVTTAGITKVLDFGIAKSRSRITKTQTGSVKGKFSYMSPEQICGDPMDHRSDLFSLGICFFELLTSRRLFPGATEYKIFQSIVDKPLPDLRAFRADLPPSVVAVAERALSRSLELRYASAGDMALALTDAAVDVGGLASPATVQRFIEAQFAEALARRKKLLSRPTSTHAERPPSGETEIVFDAGAETTLDAFEVGGLADGARLGSDLDDAPDEVPTAAAGRDFTIPHTPGGLRNRGAVGRVTGPTAVHVMPARNGQTGQSRRAGSSRDDLPLLAPVSVEARTPRPSVTDAEMDGAVDDLIVQLAETDVGLASEPLRGADRGAGLRVGRWIAVLALLGAAGAGGYYAWQMRAQPTEPQPVIVYQGHGGTVTAEAQPAGAGQASADGEIAPADAPDPSAGQPDSEPADRASVARVKGTTRSRSTASTGGDSPASASRDTGGLDRYSARLSARREALVSCLDEHADSVTGSPQLSVTIELDETGRIREASMIPASLNATPLGDCMLGVVKKVRFAPEDGSARVTIPLHIRRR